MKRKKGQDDEAQPPAGGGLGASFALSAAAESDPRFPNAKRMATANSSTVTGAAVSALAKPESIALPTPAPHRFGFGFKGPVASASALPKPAIVVPDAPLAPAVVANVASSAAGGNQIEHEAVREENAKEVAIKTEAVLRGRGHFTIKERMLARSAAQQTTSQEPENQATTASGAPLSTGRASMKQRSATSSSLTGTRKPTLMQSIAVPARASVSAGRRPSSRRLPSPTPVAPKLTPEIETSAETGKENNVPASSSQVRDAFASNFGDECIEKLETLMKVRFKANKFNVKARQDEQITYIRQLKTAIKDLCDQIRGFDSVAATLDEKMRAERSTIERRLLVLEGSLQSKDSSMSQSYQELELLRQEKESFDHQNRKLIADNSRLKEFEKHALKSRAELEESVNKLQEQLMQAHQHNDRLALELKAHQAAMSDRAQLWEEKNKELQQFYEKRDHEDEKRKSSEIEQLQNKLSSLREELAAANQEKENHKQRVGFCEDELKAERQRRSQLEMEKCTLEAQHQSLEMRINGGANDTAELKAKLAQKEDEMKQFVSSFSEIQKFTASANTKLEIEKNDLSAKVTALQSSLREIEHKDVENTALIRDLQKQLETLVEAARIAEEKEKEATIRLKESEVQVQENAHEASVQIGARQLLETQLRELRTEYVALNAQMEAVKHENKQLHAENEAKTSQCSQEKAHWEELSKTEKANHQQEVETLLEKNVSLESLVKTLRESATRVRDVDLEELCDVKRERDVLRLRLKETANHGTQSLAEKDRMIAELQEKVKQGDKTRRMMHNTIQELRGNVRVFARTRPFLPSDRCDDKDINALVPVISCEYDGQSMKIRRPAKTSSSNEPDVHSFSFDKVFPPSAGQDTVFDEVSEFVQSSIDGYHVCLFSYGQTGSGKTHTMQGSGNGQMRGIIPRAIEKVLQDCETLKLQGWNYSTQVSFLEIYNENLRDLLASKEDIDKKLAIKKDAKGGVHVPDLTQIDVTAMEQVEALMEKAGRARSVACTDMNAQSSRSHSVFTLHLQGVNDSEGIVLDGKLHLVDLAGSERASRSGVSGDRLKETQAINKSLSCLADVFSAIGNKSAHIPFRNSKLTYLLQSSLSGDGKTLMMVNLSPTMESASESLCSLRFAKHVNQCELGKPKRQIKSKKDT